MMKRTLFVAAACLVAAVAQAAPVPAGQWELRVTVQPSADMGLTPGSMYNPRTFDGNLYVTEIGDMAHRCLAWYASGSSARLAGVYPNLNEHRMVAPFRGAYSSTYLLAAGGWNGDSPSTFAATLTRYDFSGFVSTTAATIDSQVVESFDWVDDDTIISTCYASGQRKKLYLSDVTADPFALTRNTAWNANGYIDTSVSTRIRNVRVGETYRNYAYYGDNGVSVNPRVYAVNLTTGVETEVGHWNGTLKAGVAGGAATDSWGLWTVVERGGYLYLQSSDDGIQVYAMSDATTMGALYAVHTKAELDAVTGGTPAYYGFDVAPNGDRLLLGGYTGSIYELQRKGAPCLPAQLQLSAILQPYVDAGKSGSSTYNPRTFDGFDFCTQLGTAEFACGAWYPSGSSTPGGWLVPTAEHRMLAPFRGTNRWTYLLASSGAASTTFTRYNRDGTHPQAVDFVDSQRVEGFDWVDEQNIICTDYTSGNRRRLYLAQVVAEPFAISRNTLWNANGYITSAATTRIRNVRVGDQYSGYAYYGDNGVADNPKVYALNLATGVETEVGHWNGTLKAGVAGGAATDSWGLWTVVERGGYLYLHSSDDGIQVYNMIDATHMGSLHTVYSDAVLDAITADAGGSAYYGFDVSLDRKRMLLGSYVGNVYELAPPTLGVSRSGTEVTLSWEKPVTGVVIQSASGLAGFVDLDPQPSILIDGRRNTAVVPLSPEGAFFRLRKSP